MYDETAASYAKMMDEEIQQPVYESVLGNLYKRIVSLSGPIVDTSCGSGHMLSMYHEKYDKNRPLIGIDLSPAMLRTSQSRLGDTANIIAGDMCDLSMLENASVAAVINYFAIHHLGKSDIQRVANEWHRVLMPDGVLLLAAWEGSGPIDYGSSSDIVALLHRRETVTTALKRAGYESISCEVVTVEDMAMDAMYLDCIKR